MPQKIIDLTMVNADIEIKEQTERSESMRHFIRACWGFNNRPCFPTNSFILRSENPHYALA